MPSANLGRPYVAVSADVVVAPDDASARELALGYGLWVRSIRSGEGAIEFPTPQEAARLEWSAEDRDLVADRVDTQFVGSPETVTAGLERLQEATGADELVITTITHDHADRVRSYELLAKEWLGLTTSGFGPGPPGPVAQPEQAEDGQDERDVAVTAAEAGPHRGVGEVAWSGRLQVPTARTPANSTEQVTAAIRQAAGRPVAEGDRGDNVDRGGKGRQHVRERGVAELGGDLGRGPGRGGQREQAVDGDQQAAGAGPGGGTLLRGSVFFCSSRVLRDG